MKNLKQNKTYLALKAKANWENESAKMPSIKAIHGLLTELGIEHYYDGETVNVVGYRSAGKSYVNERHDGKVGKQIKFRAFVNDGAKSPFRMFGEESMSEWFDLNSADSYYSMNSYRYANGLMDVLNNYKNMTFSKK
jgi:hypothetical protein